MCVCVWLYECVGVWAHMPGFECVQGMCMSVPNLPCTGVARRSHFPHPCLFHLNSTSWRQHQGSTQRPPPLLMTRGVSVVCEPCAVSACPWDVCAGSGVAGLKGSIGRCPVGPSVLGPRSPCTARGTWCCESKACWELPLLQPQLQLDIRPPETVLLLCPALWGG